MPQLSGLTLDLWREITVATGTALAVLGFFRSLEQKKDEAYNDMTVRLCHPEAVMRAAAAHQMPSFHRYRRYLVLHRPYARQTLELAANALKVRKIGKAGDEAEVLFVTQALADSLMAMLADIDRRARRPAARLLRGGTAHLARRCPDRLRARWPVRPLAGWAGRPGPRSRVRLIQARFDNAILMGFRFDQVDLTEAWLVHCGLVGASFAGANLWKARLHHSNLEGVDFTGARLWDADLSKTNLCRARLLTTEVNPNTRFAEANVAGALLSPEVADLCRRQGCNVGQAMVSGGAGPTPPPPAAIPRGI